MKSNLKTPVFIMFMGQPGCGKSYLSRHLSKKLNIIHLNNTEIRNELFSKPTYSREEEGVVKHIMLMMAEKFMSYGLSVIYDGNAATKVERRALRDFARKNKGTPLLIWQQVDDQTCAHRATTKPKNNDYEPISKELFQKLARLVEAPRNEDYVVVSGKHTHASQVRSVIRHLHEKQLLDNPKMAAALPNPGLVNLVAQQKGRVDYTRRNISIQ